MEIPFLDIVGLGPIIRLFILKGLIIAEFLFSRIMIIVSPNISSYLAYDVTPCTKTLFTIGPTPN